jgi:DNA (cytosine-5)-methyltransferase 1
MCNRVCVIEGREVNERPQYCVTISNCEKYGFYEDGFVWCNIKSIRREKESNEVFNLSVNEEHSYNVYGIAVHNCQPFSCAGSRKGAEDDRYLWPEVLRGVDEIRPNWFIGENVAGITSMVLPGDEIKVGSYTDLEGESYLETEMRQQFIVDRICNDLESIGYSVQPIIIPACAVGAPHRRDRIWFIAHGGETIANCSNARPEGMQQGENQEFTIKSFNCSSCWENFPSQSPVCCGDDGLPSQLSGITFSKHRAESIKAYGNSMVPQLVYQIFKAIGEVENLLKLNQNKKT